VENVGSQVPHHVAQRIEHVRDEIVQLLDKERGGEDLTVEFFRDLVHLLLVRRSWHRGRPGLLQCHYFQGSVEIPEKIFVNDLPDILGHELEQVDELFQAEAGRGQAVLEHFEVGVESLVGYAVQGQAVTEKLYEAGDPTQ